MIALKGIHVDGNENEGWQPLGALTHEPVASSEAALANEHEPSRLEITFHNTVPEDTLHGIWWSLSAFSRPPLTE